MPFVSRVRSANDHRFLRNDGERTSSELLSMHFRINGRIHGLAAGSVKALSLIFGAG